jgi:hypothetical protein
VRVDEQEPDTRRERRTKRTVKPPVQDRLRCDQRDDNIRRRGARRGWTNGGNPYTSALEHETGKEGETESSMPVLSKNIGFAVTA